jgi:hypothetical protein
MNIAKVILALMIFGSIASHAQAPPEDNPAVAYVRNGALVIATVFGHTLKTVQTVPRIGTFASSADARNIIFAPLGKQPDSYGGQLYLLRLPKTIATRLTHGPYYNKSATSSEVYSNPDFSPDGKRAVFSVHSQSRGDIVEAAGPFAIIDLESGKITLLAATLHVPGEAWGTAYADSAYWSPDGLHILLNFEDGFALTDLNGKSFENLSALTAENDWTSSIGWLGSQCIIYVGGKDYPDSQKRPAKVLDLKTQKTLLLSTILGLSEQQTTDLVAVSGSIRVRRQNGHFLVESSNGQWSIPHADLKASVRLLHKASQAEIPEQCR